MGSIFSDILGTVTGFGKDIVSTIFGSILTLFFGGSWKILLHPYEIIEWLIGLPGTGYSTAFVPFAKTSGGPFAALVKDTQAIGFGLLPLAIGNNVVHLVSGGVLTRPRDHMHDFGKIFMAGAAIIAWPWLFGQAIDLVNVITLAMLNAANADGNLFKTLGAFFTVAWAGGFLDLLTTLFLIATALLLVGLIVMKIVLMVILAALLVAGPIALALYPFEMLSRILMLFGTVFVSVSIVPFGWAVLFALFAAFGASVTDVNSFLQVGILGGAASKTFDLICCLICFYLAWKWPFIIIGRVSSLVGGQVAEVGAAFSEFGHRRSGASSASGQVPGVGGESSGSGLSDKLKSFGTSIEGGAGSIGGMFGRSPGFAGYGAATKMGGAALSRMNRVTGVGGVGKVGGGGAGSGGAPAAHDAVGAAVAGGADAGFDTLRAAGQDFSATAGQAAGIHAAAAGATAQPSTSDATAALQGVGAGAAGLAAGAATGGAGMAAVGGGAGAGSSVGTQTPGAPDAVTTAAAAVSRQGAAVVGNGAQRPTGTTPATPASTPAGGGSAPAPTGPAVASPNGAPSSASTPSPVPAGAAAGGSPAGGSADPRQVFQAPSAPVPGAPNGSAPVPGSAGAQGGAPRAQQVAGPSAPARASSPSTPSAPSGPSAPSRPAPAGGSHPPLPAPPSVGHGHQPATPTAPTSVPAPSLPQQRSAPADIPAQVPRRPTPPPAPAKAPDGPSE
jgi:hypothetical protein